MVNVTVKARSDASEIIISANEFDPVVDMKRCYDACLSSGTTTIVGNYSSVNEYEEPLTGVTYSLVVKNSQNITVPESEWSDFITFDPTTGQIMLNCKNESTLSMVGGSGTFYTLQVIASLADYTSTTDTFELNIGARNNKQISDDDYDIINYINDLTFSIAGHYDDSYITGTSWIFAPVDEDEGNDYDYYMLTNAHVSLKISGTIENPKDYLNSIILTYNSNGFSSDSYNDIYGYNSQYVEFTKATDFGDDVKNKNIEVAYSNFAYPGFGSADPVQGANNPCYSIDGTQTSAALDASVIKVDFSSKVETSPTLKAKLDNINDNYFTNTTSYGDLSTNINTIAMCNTRDILKNATKEEVINVLAPDADNDGENDLYIMGWPYDGSSSYSQSVKSNYAKFSVLSLGGQDMHNVYNDFSSNYNCDCFTVLSSEFELANMLGGASGSAIVNENKEVVGIYWGRYFNITQTYKSYGAFELFQGYDNEGSNYDFIYSFLKSI